jgi:hypothetical protein
LSEDTLGEDLQTRAAFEAARKITGRPGFGGRSRDHLDHSEDLWRDEQERHQRRMALMREMGKTNRMEMWVWVGYSVAAILGILTILMMAVS